MEVGGRVQVSLGNKNIGKSSQNSPIPVLMFWNSIPCVGKSCSYFDSVHVSDGFPKNGVGECLDLDLLNFFNFAKVLSKKVTASKMLCVTLTSRPSRLRNLNQGPSSSR